MIKEPKLTPKQAKFLSLWLKTGNGTQAALEAYDANYHSARTMAAENLAKLGLTMRDYCEANGISFRQLFEKNREMFDAKKIHSSPTEPDREVPDYQIQDKAVDRFERWLGLHRKEESQSVTTNNVIIIPAEVINKYDLVSEVPSEPGDSSSGQDEISGS